MLERQVLSGRQNRVASGLASKLTAQTHQVKSRTPFANFPDYALVSRLEQTQKHLQQRAPPTHDQPEIAMSDGSRSHSSCDLPTIQAKAGFSQDHSHDHDGSRSKSQRQNNRDQSGNGDGVKTAEEDLEGCDSIYDLNREDKREVPSNRRTSRSHRRKASPRPSCFKHGTMRLLELRAKVAEHLPSSRDPDDRKAGPWWLKPMQTARPTVLQHPRSHFQSQLEEDMN